MDINDIIKRKDFSSSSLDDFCSYLEGKIGEELDKGDNTDSIRQMNMSKR